MCYDLTAAILHRQTPQQGYKTFRCVTCEIQDWSLWNVIHHNQIQSDSSTGDNTFHDCTKTFRTWFTIILHFHSYLNRLFSTNCIISATTQPQTYSAYSNLFNCSEIIQSFLSCNNAQSFFFLDLETTWKTFRKQDIELIASSRGSSCNMSQVSNCYGSVLASLLNAYCC